MACSSLRSLLPNSHPDPVALAAALAAEQVSINMYAAMVSLLRAGGGLQLGQLADHSGQSYWVVRNHVRRTSYFRYVESPSERLYVAMTELGLEKFRRIARRISRHTDADTL